MENEEVSARVEQKLKTVREALLAGHIDLPAYWKMITLVAVDFVTAGMYEDCVALLTSLPKKYYAEIQEAQLEQDEEYADTICYMAAMLKSQKYGTPAPATDRFAQKTGEA